MDNNMAFIARLQNFQKIEGADRIIQADVTLNGTKITQVVVGADTVENSMVAYFDSNLCIDPTVILDIDKASPGYGKEGFVSLGTYLGKNGRVRVIKLKGVISNGLTVDVSKLKAFLKGGVVLEEGFAFTTLGDREICKKYLPPVRESAPQGKKGRTVKAKSRLIPGQFQFHVDTSQLQRNLHRLLPDQVVSISRKIHGTSSIYGRVLVNKKLNLLGKLLSIFSAFPKTEYADVVASRTVVKGVGEDSQPKSVGFYKVDVWKDAGERNFKGKLKDGETIYFEIVGYLPNAQSMIQKGYDYGCKEGEYKIAVYRITLTTPSGDVFEYGWEQMKARCKELDVPMVQEYFYGKVKDLLLIHPDQHEDIDQWRSAILSALKSFYLEKPCMDCKSKVPDEGVVIRIEGLGIEAYKLKSEKFLHAESVEAEKGTVDIEDTQT